MTSCIATVGITNENLPITDRKVLLKWLKFTTIDSHKAWLKFGRDRFDSIQLKKNIAYECILTDRLRKRFEFHDCLLKLTSP